MGGIRARLGESLSAFAAVFENEQLRRLELAWSGSILGQWGYEVALAVFAYREGGAAAVGVVALIRLLPSALVAPFAALLGDRYPRERVMLAADLARAVAMAGAAAVALSGGPAVAVYALATLVAITGTAFQPAQSALLPSLARTPEELAAANATSTTLESAGFFIGPALGGLLLAATSVGAVFAATAATFLWSALLISRLQREARAEGERPQLRGAILREALAGFRAIATDSRLRTLVGLYGGQTLAAGVLRVLLVVVALELLELGGSGVGFLNSAVGVGALLGMLVVFGLIGGGRLAAQFRLGIVFWGLPLALLAAWPRLGPALVCFGILGAANTLVDVAGFTLLQRAAPNEVRARIFGVLESLLVGTIGLGAIAAPGLIAAFGERGALVATGVFLPALTLVFWRGLSEVEATLSPRTRELALLRGVPMFAPSPPLTLEQLAAGLVPVSVAAGADVFRQGEAGDRFYIIEAGEVDVEVDGKPAVSLGPGDSFGEIALLRDVPRTATVSARTNVELYALERHDFLDAVTGHGPSAEVAHAVVTARLGGAVHTSAPEDGEAEGSASA